MESIKMCKTCKHFKPARYPSNRIDYTTYGECAFVINLPDWFVRNTAPNLATDKLRYPEYGTDCNVYQPK